MNKLQITLRIGITDQQVSSLLTDCFEGGSNYWLERIKRITLVDETSIPKGMTLNYQEQPVYTADFVSVGGEVDLYFINEKDKPIKLTLSKEIFIRGLQRYGAKHGIPISDKQFEYDGSWDSSNSDMVLQNALFGKVIFG